MTGTRRSYDVQGLPVRACATDKELLEVVESRLGPFQTSKKLDNPFELRLRYGDFSPRGSGPPGMRLFWEGVPPGGQNRMAYYSGPRTRLIEQPGITRLHIDLRRRTADGTVRRGAEWSVPFGCIIPVLSEFLPEVGSCLMHAAAVADGPDGRAVLICGPSGSGKTTTALALTTGGFRLLTDDTTVLVRRGEEIAAWGLPRPCKVRRETVKLLPWLRNIAGASEADGREFVFDPSGLALSHPQAPARAVLLLLLEEPCGGDHRLTPAEPLAALSSLANQNVRALETRADAGPGVVFGLLASLVRQCTAFTLRPGPALEKLPELLLPLLDESDSDGGNA